MRREAFDTPGPLELTVRVPSGDIDLHTVEGTESVVELSASPELEEEARIELHPKHDGHELSVVIEKRSGLFRSFRDDIRVRITDSAGSGSRRSRRPRPTSTARGDFGAAKVNTASGDVRFEHVGGEAQVNSASGDVNIDQVDGALTVNTASGDVEIRRIQGEGKVRAASGDISIDEADSSLKVQTASGDVEVDSVREGEVTLTDGLGRHRGRDQAGLEALDRREVDERRDELRARARRRAASTATARWSRSARPP